MNDAPATSRDGTCPHCRADAHSAQTDCPRRGLDRRAFLALGSGCMLGVLGGNAAQAADEPVTVDIGTLKDFAEDGISEAFVKKGFFVIRHQGQLFAASTTCPHRGNTLGRDPADPGQIVCEGHGSTFDAGGNVSVGPASTGLVRLGIALNDKGRIIVTPSLEFPQDNWNDKGSHLAAE